MNEISERIEMLEAKIDELYKLIGNVLVNNSISTVENQLIHKNINNTRKDLN
jgi:chaperonin cofactor prefoldin